MHSELIARLEAATDALSDAADILLANGYPLVAESYRNRDRRSPREGRCVKKNAPG